MSKQMGRVTYAEFKRRVDKILDRVEAEGSLLLTKDGKPLAVLVSAWDYVRLTRMVHQLEGAVHQLEECAREKRDGNDVA